MPDRHHTSNRVPEVGDRVRIEVDGYSEPRGSYAVVTEVHPDQNALTVRWEHLNGTESLPVWVEDVVLA